MKKVLILLTCIIFLTSCQKKYEIKSSFNEDVYIYDGIEIPLALGEPKLDNNKKMNRIDVETYADSLIYMKNKEYSDENIFYTEFANILKGDYEEIEIIDILADNVQHKISSIKTNDKYYLVDPFSIYKGNTKWLQDYNLENGSFDSKQDLEEALHDSYIKSGNKIVCINPKDSDGQRLTLFEKDGEYYYKYNGFEFALGYGLPKLSKEERCKLVKEAENGNFNLVIQQITTIPDMICFSKEYGIKEAGYDNIVSTEKYGGADVGNIWYRDDNFGYTLSGKELMIVKEVQCSASSTLFYYLLAGDYEEVGYVPIVFISKDTGLLDGHAINYIKTNDMYYLVSPSYYLSGDNAWQNNGIWKGCDSLDVLMEELYSSSYPAGKVVSTAAYIYDGVYVMSDQRNNNTGKVSMRTFPEGSDIKVCLGSEYNIKKPIHQTDNDYILGVQFKH